MKDVLTSDHRPPVIYFRSFADDAQTKLFDRFEKLGRTEEEKYVKQLKRLGPVIAIGNPDEKLPLAGAARCYSSHDQWRAVAHDLLTSAALVVYRVGVTPGFIWEIKRGRDILRPEKVLLLIPSELEYDAFRNAVKDFLPLPEMASTGPLITFNQSWQAMRYAQCDHRVARDVQIERLLKRFADDTLQKAK